MPKRKSSSNAHDGNTEEKMVQLDGQDMATGQHAETASEMRRRKVQNEGNTIDEIDVMDSQNTINLESLGENENVDVHDNENEDEASPMATNQQSQFDAPSSFRSKKVKGSDGHDDIKKLCMAVESVANAIIQSTNAWIEVYKTWIEITTNIMKKCFANSDPTKDCDVWAMLTDLGISQPFLFRAYMFLIKDPKMLECLIRCPNEHRKSLLLTMMGYDHEPEK